MFGFSLSKLLFTILVVAGVWRVFKFLQAREQKQSVAATGRRRNRWRSRASEQAVELVPCPKCGAYVPPDTNCPSREQCRLDPPKPKATT